MAIYHFSVKTISRGAGRSAVACSAYRSGEKLLDERQGKEQDYTRKTGVEFTKIYAPENTNPELLDRNQLWNTVEKVERRKDANLAREFEIAFPHELNAEQRQEMLNELCQELVKRHGVIVDAAIHAPHTQSGSDERNYHAHIMFTGRQIDLETGDFAKKRNRDFNKENSSQTVNQWRETFADIANKHLARAGYLSEVDHRSYADQENGLQATIHEGSKVTQLRRQGINTEVSLKNDKITLENLKKTITETLDQNITLSEEFINNAQQEIKLKKAEDKYIEIINQKINQMQSSELSELKFLLEETSSKLSNLEQKEPLFFKAKWTDQMNDLINQYNTNIDTTNSISKLSELEKNTRYLDTAKKWAESNQLSYTQQPSHISNIFNGMQDLIVKQEQFDKEILDLDTQISLIEHQLLIERSKEKPKKIFRELTKSEENLIFEQSLIFELDNYGNKYLSPKNTDEQRRRYNEKKHIEDYLQRMRQEEYALVAKMEAQIETGIAELRRQQAERAREARLAEENMLKKDANDLKMNEERREREYQEFLKRQEFEKQHKNEHKNHESDNNNDYTP